MYEKDAANDAWLEPSQRYMMEFFAKTVKDLLFSQKTSIIDIWHGSKYRSSCLKVFCEKVFLKITENLQENTWIS